MTAVPAIRLERKKRGWSQRAMAVKLRQASGDPHTPDADSLTQMISRWERGQHRPGEQYRLLYCLIFGKTEEELFGIMIADGSAALAPRESKYITLVIPEGLKQLTINFTEPEDTEPDSRESAS